MGADADERYGVMDEIWGWLRGDGDGDGVQVKVKKATG